MTKPIKTVDLTDYHTKGVRIMSGRGRGVSVREKADIEHWDDQLAEESGATVTVVIPAEVVFVASSFYLGLFGPSIRRFGADGFEERYRFEGPHSEANLRDGIKEAIYRDNREAVKRGSPLPAVPA